MKKPQATPLRHSWLAVLAALLAAVVLAILLFRWDWIIPLVESRLSSPDRQVTLQHLHVEPGRSTRVVAEDVAIAGSAGAFATVARVDATFDAIAYFRNHVLHVFRLDLDRPVIEVGRTLFDAIEQADGRKPQIDALQVENGQAHLARPGSDLDATLAFAGNGQGEPFAGTIEGKFRSQPISGRFTGGTLASLQDPERPFPVSLQVAIGANRLAVDGTVSAAGGTLKASVAGEHFAGLAALLGLPLDGRAAYNLSSPLTFADRTLRFERLEAKIGSSVLSGSFSLTAGPGRPQLSGTLGSSRILLTDFSSFETHVAQDERFHAPRPAFDADFKLHLDRLEYGKSVVENVAAAIVEKDGRVTLSPVGFDAAGGKINGSGSIELADTLGLQATFNAAGVQLRHLLNGPGLTLGGGSVNGHLDFRTNGDSVAALLRQTDGRVVLLMNGGADFGGILTSMAGLDFRAVFLSSLGIASSEQIRCALLDFGIKGGVARPNRLVIDTRRALIRGTGTVDLGHQTLDLTLRPAETHGILG
ncbi:MAG: AsmA family protein, partial [Acidisphaera sp.]|nr:AsmA family protein [Acidisphaera sp.]